LPVLSNLYGLSCAFAHAVNLSNLSFDRVGKVALGQGTSH